VGQRSAEAWGMIMITREMFAKFQKVMTSGSVDMQGVKAREAAGLVPDDYNEILANYSAYSEQFAEAEEAPDDEPEDNGPSDDEIDEMEIEEQVSAFHEEPEEEGEPEEA